MNAPIHPQDMESQAAPQTQDSQAQHPHVVSTHDALVDMHEFKFTFREDKLGNRRPAVEVKLPVPSYEGVAEIFNAGGKGLEALLSLVKTAIQDHSRGLLTDDESITTENFPYDKATWEAYVNTPEAERKGRGIAKEIWEAFGKDYIEQMPAVTGKKPEAIELAAKHLLNKFQAVKMNKDVISKLKDYLAIYLNQTPNAEQFVECVKFLVEKADTLLKADETALLDNL